MNWYFEALKKYGEFSGRAQRSEFWYFFLFYLLIYSGLSVVDGITGTFSTKDGIGLLGAIFSIGMLIPSAAVCVRRLHDSNRTGWWLLIGLIPLAGVIVLLIFTVQDGQPGQNEYGPNPKENATVQVPASETPRSQKLVQTAAVIIIVVIIAALGLWIGVGAMRDREVKEQTVIAFRSGQTGAKYARDYYVKNGQWPNQSDFAKQLPNGMRGIRAINIDSMGKVIVTMGGRTPEAEGKTISFTPAMRNGTILWTCETDYLEKKTPNFVERYCNESSP